MKYMLKSVLILIFLIEVVAAQKQTRSKGIFKEDINEFWELIDQENESFKTYTEIIDTVFSMDFSGLNLPTNINQFKSSWHQPPLSQGNTSSCWCFCTTSFFESEIYRIYGKKIKLSEMYTVYWEFVEKASRFVNERGNSLFSDGSMSNAVIRIWKKYGIVPEEMYSGMLPGQKFHDHSDMFAEMQNYLEFIKENNIWNESEVLGNIKAIMNHYMGEPPLRIVQKDREITPLEYLENYVRLNLDDYIDVISLKQKPYNRYVVHPVPDNWWFDDHYLNLPLTEFTAVVNKALSKGYTLVLGGDVSEAGYDAHQEVGMVPTFDIPSEYIDEDARQFRFSNKSTTDDHGIHAVGLMNLDGNNWYLIKDSGSGAHNGPNKGYRFYHQDYVKLKMLDIMVHKDILGDLPDIP